MCAYDGGPDIRFSFLRARLTEFKRTLPPRAVTRAAQCRPAILPITNVRGSPGKLNVTATVLPSQGDSAASKSMPCLMNNPSAVVASKLDLFLEMARGI
jgi:hypothetical protein